MPELTLIQQPDNTHPIAPVVPVGCERPLSETLPTAIEHIVQELHPEQIILFGSYAYGTPTHDSDVDLLVVMETSASSTERYLMVSRLLSPRPFPVDILVKTPYEIQQALDQGDFFIREIVSQGQVLYERLSTEDERQAAEYQVAEGREPYKAEITDPYAWVGRAEQDYIAAYSSLRRKKPLTYVACFHAQQCAEKYLKAALVSEGQIFPKVHDLARLSDQCAQAGISLALDRAELDTLSAYAVRIRYPGEDPTVEEAKRALEIAKAVRRLVRRWLGLR